MEFIPHAGFNSLMSEMETHTEKLRHALTAFKDKGGFTVGRWEKEAGLGDGTLRKFLDGVATTFTDRTLHRLAEGATKILRRPVTAAELLGDTNQPPAERRLFVSHVADDGSVAELISRLMNELYDPETMPAGSDKEQLVIALARHLRKQMSKN